MTAPASPPTAPTPYIDPDLVVIESVVNGPDDAEVMLDVVDIIAPRIIRACWDSPQFNHAIATLYAWASDPYASVDGAIEMVLNELADAMREEGVGVLVMPDVMAADIGYRIAEGPARCHATLDRTTRERCQNYADACLHLGGAE